MKRKRPTREQYSRNIEYLQQKNLNSEVFKKVYKTVDEYVNRGYRDIEYKWLKQYKKFEREVEKVKYSDGDFGRAYNYYLGMCDFINQLPNDVIESNCLLKRVKMAINSGYVDSVDFVCEFITQVENYGDSHRYVVELPLSSELSSCFLDWVETSEMVMTPEDEEDSYQRVNAVPDEYIDYYHKYDELSKQGNLMLSRILNYQMMMILSSCPYKVTVQLPELLEGEDGMRNMSVDFLRSLEREAPKLKELK